MNISRLIAASFVATSLVLPATVFAATPQQVLNQAIQSSMDRVPLWMSGEMTLNISQRPLLKNGTETYGTVKLGLVQRVLSRDVAAAQSEGRVMLNQFDFHTSSADSEMPLKIDSGLAIQWKTVGTKTYARLEQLPEQAAVFLKAAGFDTGAVVGQWIETDQEMGVEQVAQTLSPAAAMGLTTSESLTAEQTKLLKTTPVFLVRRIEKREQTADGHTVLRLRVAFNPRVVTILHQAELKAIDRKDPLRTEKIRTVNRQFAKLRSILAGMQFVAVVDQTTQTLTRMEIGGRYRAPQQTCTTNWTTGRETCRNASMLTVTYQAGMSFATDVGPAVTVPEGAITFTQLVERLRPTESSTSTDELPAPEATSTDMSTM